MPNNTTPIPAAGYTRYSSEMQRDGFSLAAQERQIRERAERDVTKIVALYSDEAISAYKRKRRPGIDAMLQGAKEGKFKILYVHKLDRLARNIRMTWEIIDKLREYGVALVAIEQPFDLTKPEGKMLLSMMAMFAEFYSDNLSLETRKGKKERSQKGYHNGHLPWGYETDMVNDRVTAKLIPEKGTAIKTIFEMYATGLYSDQDIAKWLNNQGFTTNHSRQFSKDTVRDMLQNIFYCGKTHFRGAQEKNKGKSYRNIQGIISDGLHEAVITEELFEQCQKSRKARRKNPIKNQPKKHIYLLSGIIKCHHCGRNLRAQSAGNGLRYYREVSSERGFNDCPITSVTKKSIQVHEIESQIEDLIIKLELPVTWKRELERMVSDQAEKLPDIKAERKKIKDELRRVRINFEMGMYGDDIFLYKQRVQSLQEKLERLTLPEENIVDNAAQFLISIRNIWQLATAEEKERIVKMIFREVSVSIESNDIMWVCPNRGFELLFDMVPVLSASENGRYVPVK